MELIGTRMLDGLRAAQWYARACELPPDQALPLLAEIETLTRANRDRHQALGQQFKRLWLADCRPYALDWTMNRYDVLDKWYEGLLQQLAKARQAAQQGQPLPALREVGLAVPPAK